MPFGIFANKRFEHDSKIAQPIPYIGWAGPFSEIGLARWLRQVFRDRDPDLMLTTFHGHVEAARQGIGAVGLPLFVGRMFPELVQIPSIDPAFMLEAWLVVPVQVRDIVRVKAVARFVEETVKDALRL
jgi:hypothetical protein